MSGAPHDATVTPVDLTGWFEGDEAARDATAALVDEACSRSGFLAVTGHRIDPALIDDMLAVTTAFFDLPLVEKLRYRPDDLAGNRGYAPEGAEALSYSLGEESPPDLFEAFNIGREVVPADVDAATALRYYSPNIWPTEPAPMRQIWLAYWDACEQLGDVLLAVFARALGLPDRHFAPYLGRSISVMRANNYQRRAGAPPPVDGQLRMGAHSDYGSLTVLLADRVPGLQLLGADGAWHDVVPPEGGFVVNLGDLLARWTNDRWRSTLHRVVPPPPEADGSCRRRSIAWFQQPDHDALIEVLPTCVTSDRPARYGPITSGDHLLAKLMGPRTLSLDPSVDGGQPT